MKVKFDGIKKNFTKFVEKCKSFVGKETKQEESAAVYECRNKIGSHHQPKQLKIWQILEAALEHLAMNRKEIELGKEVCLCFAISRAIMNNYENHSQADKVKAADDAKNMIQERLGDCITLSQWLISKGYVSSYSVFYTEEGFAKLQLTRKMWLLDMIAECKAKDI